MIAWIMTNEQIFGVLVTLALAAFSGIFWLIKKAGALRTHLKDHDDKFLAHDEKLTEHEVIICEMKENAKEVNKEILSELKALNTNYTTIAVSVGKLEGWVDAQKNNKNHRG